ncbi:MAG: hypothetical protein IJQ02_11900 [Oscillospiraceae bacterium]|nr:hypothetical protein [Oscillospiraceae bacterium]
MTDLPISIRERAKARIPSYGLTITLPDPMMIEMAYRTGYDFARIDAEHRLFGDRLLLEMLNMARLLNFPVIVRSATLDNATAILGHDAAGIVVPHCDNAETARAAVELCKYAPLGQRGMDKGARRIRYNGMERLEYMQYANDRTDLIIQIESRKGIENLDEILSIDGIDMVCSGRSDLSQEFGVPGQRDNPDVIAAEDYIIEKALAYGKVLCLGVENVERAQLLVNKGVFCFMVDKDENLAFNAMKNSVKKYHDNIVVK